MKTNLIIKCLFCAILAGASAAHAEARQSLAPAEAAIAGAAGWPVRQIAFSCGNAGSGSVTVPVAKQFVQPRGAIAWRCDDRHIPARVHKR